MSTLLRTHSSASKLITGAYPSGALPKYPLPNLVQPVTAKDVSDNLLVGQSLQNDVSRQVNASVAGFSSIRSVKPISVVSRRYAHTDVNFPNFDTYRNDASKDPFKPAIEEDDARRVVPNSIIYGVGGAVSLFLAKDIVQGVIHYKSMAADQMALANIEVKTDDVPEGKCKTYEWRGKPVFVRHRTAAEIEEVRKVNTADLRDAQTDEERVKKAEWSVLIGICTHLGCVPFAGMGDFNGYYCPCHGSHYDASGRIRKGPAPLNLLVPDYEFVEGDSVIKIG